MSRCAKLYKGVVIFHSRPVPCELVTSARMLLPAASGGIMQMAGGRRGVSSSLAAPDAWGCGWILVLLVRRGLA